MAQYWFKPKKYGWGFQPINWQGWLATAGFVALVLASAYCNGFFGDEVTPKDAVRYCLDLIILCALFLTLFKGKTEGGLK
jgi:hypothetical protein